MDEKPFATLAIDRETYNRLGDIGTETRRSRQDVIRYLLDHVQVVGKEIRVIDLAQPASCSESSR